MKPLNKKPDVTLRDNPGPSGGELEAGSGSALGDGSATGGRILYVITSLDVGGSERHLVQLLPSLARRGRDVAVYCLYRRGIQAEDLQKSGIEVLGPPFERPADAIRGIGDYARHVALLLKLFGLLISRRPDIVHFFLHRAYIMGAPLARIARIPVRIMSRRSLNLYQLNWRHALSLERRLHPQMTALLGNSRAVVDDLVEKEGSEPEKVHLIYNGVDLSRFSDLAPQAELRQRLGIPETAFVAAIVANLIPYKGHEDLLRALARIRDQLPKPWQLLCIGRDDGPMADLRALAEQEGLASNVRFLGSRDDVPELLSASDIGILCSHQEGFANAILEGMAAGLPMVVSDVGGNAEAVLDGETGLVVPARDPAALGDAILELASNPRAATAMGEAARQRAQEHFSLEQCISRYDALYGELLGTLAGQPASGLEVRIDQDAPVPADLIARFYRKYDQERKAAHNGLAHAISPGEAVPERLDPPDPDPVVSVIMPVYNDAVLVGRAVESVLEQTFPNFELIVIDDCSTDGLTESLSALNDPRIKVLHHEQNKGAAAARNSGITQARGDYVAFLDADDCWLPDKLERQLGFMRKSRGRVRMCCTGYENISPYHPEGEIRITPPVLTEQDLHSGCRVSPGATLMAERALFTEVGPMNEALPRLEDWEWLLRATRITNLESIKDILSIVDYSAAGGINYESVRLSTRMLKRSYLESAGPLPAKDRRKFFGTLENELAAAAYRNRRYDLASWHLLRSFLYSPYRNREYFSRLKSAVFTDSKKLVGPALGKPNVKKHS